MRARTAICLLNERARTAAVRAVMDAPDQSWADVKPLSKTREQEERYHAMIGDCAKQCQHLNRNLDAETWKRLLVDQFRRDTMDDPEIGEYWQRNRPEFIPGLDGSAVVVMGEQTRRFPKKVASAFIEWLFAFGAERDVKWMDPTVPSDETLQEELERAA